jgi:hypothetical protein
MSIVVDNASPEQPMEAPVTEVEAPIQPIQEESSVPEKYAGKSIDDVISMHQNAEKALGKRGQELGEHRKLIESLLSNRESTTPSVDETVTPPITQEEPVDFYDDPALAVKSAIDNHPDILQAKVDRETAAKEVAFTKMESQYPDYKDIVNDTNFIEWVESSEIRKELFQRADGYDYNSANELFGTWKQLSLLDNTRQVKEAEKTKRTKALRQTSTEGRSSGDSVGGKKMYRRSDLINLQVTDPRRYASLADEIQQAYAEGRVK